MKKYYISRPILSIMLCITFLLNLLTGCTNETPHHLAIVYAACQNNPVPMMNGQLYETLSDTAGIFDSTMSVFVADQSCYRAYYRRFESPNMTLVDRFISSSYTPSFTYPAVDMLTSKGCVLDPNEDFMTS